MNQNNFAEYQPYIFLAIGLIVLAVSIFWVPKENKLKQTGIPVDGIIFEGGNNQSFDNSYNDKIVIRFVTQNQEWITGAIQQDFATFYTGQYKNGEKVKVYYDKDNPSNFYVETKQSELLGRVIGILVGLVFIVVALYRLLS